MSLLPVVLVAVLIISLLARSRRPKAPGWTVPALTSELDRLEILMLRGDSQHAASSLTQIEPEVMRLKSAQGNLLRVRLGLSAGDFFGWTNRPDAARAGLEQALTDIDGVSEPELALELRARGECALSLLASVDAADPVLTARARSALECEPRIRRPEVLMRLVWAAHRLAGIEHLQGRWAEARALFERAVAIGGRLERPGAGLPTTSWNTDARELFWSHGRKVASEAARDLAFVLESLGDREGTMRWLDEAVALMEGATLPVARLRLAHALIERATHEPVDAFTGITGHEALLGRAAEVALSCGTDDGKTVACMAESARASLYPSLGMNEKTLEHLRLAMELTGHMTEPAAGYNQTYLHMALGFALEENGERAAAIESHRRAVERGRTHPDPDARKLASQSAYRLHQLLFEEERLPDARRCVEVLEQLAPTLSPPERTSFAGVAAHSRGLQQMLEGHPDEARRSLTQAETMAHQAGAVALARAAAMDQGRLALRLERPAEALPHLQRALETAVPQPGTAENQARLADIRLCLANAFMMLERRDEALVECRCAFDTGRGSGNANGREIAAIAAMHLGEAAEDEPAERRRYYEAASRLGRLCGRPRGRVVADTVDARLRDLPG